MRNAVVILLTLFSSFEATAVENHCSFADQKKQELAAAMLNSEEVYDCCIGAISSCLKKAKICPLAVRLKNRVCKLIKDGEDAPSIKEDLELRKKSMSSSVKKVDINLSGYPPLGNPLAKTVLIEYVCLRCPFCQILTMDLYQKITAGVLKNKVRLYVKPIQLKSHPGSKELALTLLAANRAGNFWPFLIKAYENFDDYKPDKLSELSKTFQVDKKYSSLASLESTFGDQMAANWEEVNSFGTKAVPDLFINGRHYLGRIDPDTVLDVVEEDLENISQ